MSPNVRFRPRVEECEPRLVPSGDGIWHTLIQAGKAQNQAVRQALATVRDLSDPFCGGLEPGPCANPDVVRLRSNLYALGNYLQSREQDLYSQYLDARATLDRLVADRAPFAQIWPAQLNSDYAMARDTQASADADDIRGVSNVNDQQLLGWSHGLIRGWLFRAGGDAQAEKQAQRDRDRALAARDYNAFQRAERNFVTWQGGFDQQVEDIANFVYYVNL